MGKPIAQVAGEVLAVERSWQGLPAAHRHATLVALGDRTYPVSVTDTLDRDLVRDHGGTRVAVITDRNVRPTPAGSATRSRSILARRASRSTSTRGCAASSRAWARSRLVIVAVAAAWSATWRVRRSDAVGHPRDPRPDDDRRMTDSAIAADAIDLPGARTWSARSGSPGWSPAGSTRSSRCRAASGGPGSASCGSTRCSMDPSCGARSPRWRRGRRGPRARRRHPRCVP